MSIKNCTEKKVHNMAKMAPEKLGLPAVPITLL
jgi:hypothetical protein